nr:unnamed protein product [Spirometra erinaceieuropaei]
MNKVPGPPIMSIRIVPILSSLLTAKRGPEIGRILVKTAAFIFIFDPRDGRVVLKGQTGCVVLCYSNFYQIKMEEPECRVL